MSDALVSVILPVYNAEKVLHRCIDSILCQTYRNIEVLVVDDGSTDGSVSVARSIADDRVVIIETAHKGVSHARNIGLQRMNGQFFTFVDADDYVANTYVETMLSDIEEHQADIAFTRLEFHYQNEVFDYNETTDNNIILADGRKVIESCFGLDENRRGYNAGVCGRLFRTAFYLKQKVQFDICFTYGEDAKWLFTHVMWAKQIVMNDKIGYYYHRVRGKYTDHAANIRYYAWRLSFYRDNGMPAEMISTTENLLRENQFACLMKEYLPLLKNHDRIILIRQYPDLLPWCMIKQKGWNLGRIKRVIVLLLMRIGIPGRLVHAVWNLQRTHR